MKIRANRVSCALLMTLFASVPTAHVSAVGTVAGSNISNQASVEYLDINGNPVTEFSNTVILRVDELLDVTVARNDASDIPVLTSALSQPLSFHVTNKGNGPEAFHLAVNPAIVGDQFDPLAVRLAFDTNNNGIYDPSVDLPYTPGQNDPLLTPDQTITVFVLGDMPTSLNFGDRGVAELSATALTGSGTPGTVYANRGEGGGDAVIGSTSALARDTSSYVARLVDVQIVKTQSILDPAGGTSPVTGAIVTYTLTARLTGAGQLSNAKLIDPVPAQTSYLAGSLRLNGTALTDIADSDIGEVSNGSVLVALGSLTAPATQTITFQVKLN
jgi:uncharacterized repeat protein (TIGR01451 family)